MDQANPESPLLIGSATYKEADEWCDAMRGWNLNFQQLDRGPFLAAMEIWAHGKMLIQHSTLSRRFHQAGDAPHGMITLGLVDNPESLRWRGGESAPGHLQNFCLSGGLDCVSEPGFGAHTLSIPSESFVEDCRVMGFGVSIDELRRGPGQIAASPTDIRRLRQLLSMRTSVTAMSHLGVEEFVADIRYLLATIVGRFESKCKSIKHPQRHHGVDRAIELIREKQGAVSIVEVCAQASISARSLSRGFRERFGLSTKQYIVATRLGTVRRRLRRHGLSVTEAACESGFWHLGRFSSDYQRMFGELPSETIRRI